MTFNQDVINEKLIPNNSNAFHDDIDLKSHPLFKKLHTLEHLQIFMQYHVFAVFDFMSLAKALQMKLSPASLPWMPPRDNECTRFINEIMLAEESDQFDNIGPISHFDLYKKAMNEVGASTQMIDEFISHLQSYSNYKEALELLPEPLKNFVGYHLQLAIEGEDFEIASSFFFGREEPIPSMFQSILQEKLPESCFYFKAYLQRHIEIDGDEHGPMAKRLLDVLCHNDPAKMNRVREVAVESKRKRLDLWNAITGLVNCA